MRGFQHRWNMPEYTSVGHIWAIGDTHVGTIAFNETLLKTNVEKIKKDENAKVIVMGDMCECININDKRYDPKILSPEFRGHEDDLVKRQCDKFCELVSPISDKIIGICGGNHEDKIRKTYYFDPLSYVCNTINFQHENANVYNLGYGQSMIRITIIYGNKEISSKTRTIYVSTYHGHAASKNSGSNVNSLINECKVFDADIYLRGHSHDLFSKNIRRFQMKSRGKPEIHNTPRMFVATGSYMDTYIKNHESYAEKRGYLPSEMGSPCISIKCKQQDFHLSTSIHSSEYE